MLIIGEYKPRPKQLSEQAIRIVEKALIEHALTEGYELLNKAGTKTPTHEVSARALGRRKSLQGNTVRQNVWLAKTASRLPPTSSLHSRAFSVVLQQGQNAYRTLARRSTPIPLAG
jgi:hypothetical protein